MKLEQYFKYFCLLFASIILINILHEILNQPFEWLWLLEQIGLFFSCVSMGVLMTYDQLSAKVTLRNFITSEQKISLSPVGIFAHTLGQIGVFLLISGWLIKVVQYFMS